MREGTDTSQGKAQLISNINACGAVVDAVRSTLGPRGMDKLMYDGTKVTISNDGATIMKLLDIVHPAARVLAEISMSQDSEVGDGTTSVAVLCGELLREAEKLIDARVHPQTIAAGWRLAAKLAKAELEKAATRETNEEKFRERLMEIARTTLSSKLVLYEKEHFAKLAVDASEASKVQAPFNSWCGRGSARSTRSCVSFGDRVRV